MTVALPGGLRYIDRILAVRGDSTGGMGDAPNEMLTRKTVRQPMGRESFFQFTMQRKDALQRICTQPNLLQAEVGQAMIGAYFQSLRRGNGTLPAHDPIAAADEFASAAGDLLSNL